MLLGIYNGKIGHALHFDTDCKKLSPPTVVSKRLFAKHLLITYAVSATVGSIKIFIIVMNYYVLGVILIVF